MMERTIFNEAQLDLLQMMAFVQSPEALCELRQVVKNHFTQKAKEEMQRMWQTGEMTQQKYDSFRTLHERTPYNKPTYAEHRP